jgi:hypothetical protein
MVAADAFKALLPWPGPSLGWDPMATDAEQYAPRQDPAVTAFCRSHLCREIFDLPQGIKLLRGLGLLQT